MEILKPLGKIVDAVKSLRSPEEERLALQQAIQESVRLRQAETNAAVHQMFDTGLPWEAIPGQTNTVSIYELTTQEGNCYSYWRDKQSCAVIIKNGNRVRVYLNRTGGNAVSQMEVFMAEDDPDRSIARYIPQSDNTVQTQIYNPQIDDFEKAGQHDGPVSLDATQMGIFYFETTYATRNFRAGLGTHFMLKIDEWGIRPVGKPQTKQSTTTEYGPTTTQIHVNFSDHSSY